MSDEPRKVSLAVLPDTANTLRSSLETVACWRLGDGVFRHDHKVIHPSAKEAFAEFWEIRDRFPDAPVALFGHADPSGKDAYNHDLAAERAQAVYAVLNRDPDMWYELFANDQPALANLKAVLADYGLDTSEQGYGEATKAAVGRYMEDLGGGRSLEPFDYLDDGEHAMQSCGEFNPVVRAGKELANKLSNRDRKRLEAVNRRVLAYFFVPGTYAGDAWPCPVAGEGVGKCTARFWSDAEQRRRAPKKPKQYWPKSAKGRPRKPFGRSEATFACRFYERMVQGHRCELVNPWRPKIEKPPEPDEPEEPEEPDEPVIDEPDEPEPPVEPEPPEIWTIGAHCSHPDHINSHKKLGKVDKVNMIAVVPGVGGDKLELTILPDGPAAWQIGTRTTTGDKESLVVPRIAVSKPKPWDLIGLAPVVRKVLATRDGVTRELSVHSYPDEGYSVDLEPYRKLIRDDIWSVPLIIIKKAALVFTEDFELEVLEKKGFDGRLETQWREFRRKGRTPSDYRAYLHFLMSFKAEPLIRNKFDMEFSVGKLLKKLKKISWLKKKLDKLPKRIRKAIDAIKLVGKFDASGGGKQIVRMDKPGDTVPKVGDGKRNKMEFGGTCSIEWLADMDLEDVFSEKDRTELGKFRLSLSFGFDFTMGLILDVEDKREIGAYVKGKIHPTDLFIEVGLPIGTNFHGTVELHEGGEIDPRSKTVSLDLFD